MASLIFGVGVLCITVVPQQQHEHDDQHDKTDPAAEDVPAICAGAKPIPAAAERERGKHENDYPEHGWFSLRSWLRMLNTAMSVLTDDGAGGRAAWQKPAMIWPNSKNETFMRDLDVWIKRAGWRRSN